MKRNIGTPQSLKEAIGNGVKDCLREPQTLDIKEIVSVLYDHVKNFEAQKFGGLFFLEGDAGKLAEKTFYEIFPE